MLTDMAVRKAGPRPKAYKLTDGGGLFLLVKPTGLLCDALPPGTLDLQPMEF